MKYEIKKGNRWMVKFSDPWNIPPYCFSNVSSIKYDYQTRQWEDVIFTIRNTASPKITQQIMENIRLHKFAGLEVLIEYFDSDGHVIERWEMKGRITSVHFPDLDWKDEILYLDIIFKPSEARVLD